jgi:hypothetical protein
MLGFDAIGRWSIATLPAEDLVHYSIVAEAAAFTLTGQAVTLRAARKLTVDAAAFTFTGQTANFHVSMPAAAAAFVLTGQDATLRASRRVTAEAGTFALTGQDVSLEFGARLVAEASSFVLTGQTVSLEFGGQLDAETGVFILTGQAVGVLAIRFLSAETGAFWVTGQETVALTGLAEDYGLVADGTELTRDTVLSTAGLGSDLTLGEIAAALARDLSLTDGDNQEEEGDLVEQGTNLGRFSQMSA